MLKPLKIKIFKCSFILWGFIFVVIREFSMTFLQQQSVFWCITNIWKLVLRAICWHQIAHKSSADTSRWTDIHGLVIRYHHEPVKLHVTRNCVQGDLLIMTVVIFERLDLETWNFKGCFYCHVLLKIWLLINNKTCFKLDRTIKVSKLKEKSPKIFSIHYPIA